MGLADLFKSKKAKPVPAEDSDLPNVSTEAAAVPDNAAPRSKAEQKEFRARETEAVQAAENEGLPSVNRRRGRNKLVTNIGYLVIFGAAIALILAVNTEKGPKLRKKPAASEMISNNLPSIATPAVPAQLGAPVSLGGSQPSSAAAPASGGAKPIALQGGTVPAPVGTPGATKPVLDWTDRKMGGTLLVAQSGTPSSMPAAATATRGVSDQDGMTPSVFPTGNRPGSSPNDLSTRLEPTITRGVSASMLPDRNFLITKGTTLDCALETALDSTVPGITTCRLTRDVYSDNGQILLLDRGSQLVGEYQGGMRQGQVRLFVLWSRAKTPNGVVVALNSPGTDALGRSGLEGWVDNHFIERFGAAILMSFIKDSVTALANRGNGTGGTTNVYGSTTNGGERVVEKILESTVNIPPTLIKNQGDHIQVMVARDLDFSSVYSLQIKE